MSWPIKVSIVMPAYNSAGTIDDAIASCLAQTEPSWELIVVDDASRDDTPNRVEAYDDTRIALRSLKENRGPGHARNVALAIVRGRWVTVLDADDTYHPARLENLIEAASHAPRMAVLLDSTIRSEHHPVWERVVNPPLRHIPKEEIPVNGLIGKPFVPRSLIEATRASYPEGVLAAEDTAFLLTILSHPETSLHELPVSLYWLRMREDSLTKSPADQIFMDRERVYRDLLEQPTVALTFGAKLERELALLPGRRRASRAVELIRDGRILSLLALVVRNPSAVPGIVVRLFRIARYRFRMRLE